LLVLEAESFAKKGTSGLLSFTYVLPNEINTTPRLWFFFQHPGNGDRQVASLKYALRIPVRKCLELLSTVGGLEPIQTTANMSGLLLLLCLFLDV
jgi:hypothetical protein